VKKDSGRYKCIQRSGDANSQYVTTETVLEVIDVSYLPELDDWQVNFPSSSSSSLTAAAAALFF